MHEEIWNYMTKKDDSVQCCFCGRIFIDTFDLENLLSHLEKNHIHEYDQEVKDVNRKGSNDQLESNLIEEHQNDIEDNLLPPEMKENYENSSVYWKYFERISDDPSKAICKLCQTQIFIFANELFNEKYLLSHLQKVHPRLVRAKNYLCSICGKQFYNNQRKTDCEAYHAGDPRLKCSYDGCSMQFTMVHSVKKHISAVHKKLKPHTCEQCGRSFNQRQHLKTHLRVHTGETPFECDKCQKKFKFHATRNSHKCVANVIS